MIRWLRDEIESRRDEVQEAAPISAQHEEL